MAAVSIVLPTYNRARFLPNAFASIQAQTFQDWELIVVDDGSVDDTRAIVDGWCASARVTYVHRENGGAYAARNTGLDHATGTYVAFFDSDDLWLPHHLERCVQVLNGDAGIDWVYAACTCIDEQGTVVDETTFRLKGVPRRFLTLRTRPSGRARVIDDPGALTLFLEHGFYCGLQNSVIRRTLFEKDRFWEDYKVVEDVVFAGRTLARGARFAYLDDVHVRYRIHDGNSSASAKGVNRANLLAIHLEYVRGLERLRRETRLRSPERAALRRSLSGHYFWNIGYHCRWQSGDRVGALREYGKALRLTPFDLRKWKTTLAAGVKLLAGSERDQC